MLTFGRFLDLPIDLVCAIVSQWIELESVPFLDNAYCSNDMRPVWLGAVLGSPYCILSGECSTVGATIMNLICRRNARVDDMWIATHDDMIACMHQSDRYGSCVKSITFVDVAMYEENSAQRIIYICSRCKNLTSLLFCDCIINESIFNILNCAGRLESLQFWECWDMCKISSFDTNFWLSSRQKNIQNVTLFCQEGYSPVVNTVLKLLCPSKLLRLYVCCDTIIEMQNTLQLLKQCGSTLKGLGFMSPYFFQQENLIDATIYCPCILHLDVSNLEELTNETFATAMQNLTHLQTLNIAHCSLY